MRPPPEASTEHFSLTMLSHGQAEESWPLAAAGIAGLTMGIWQETLSSDETIAGIRRGRGTLCALAFLDVGPPDQPIRLRRLILSGIVARAPLIAEILDGLDGLALALDLPGLDRAALAPYMKPIL